VTHLAHVGAQPRCSFLFSELTFLVSKMLLPYWPVKSTNNRRAIRRLLTCVSSLLATIA
jgi:hypothetical protein